MEAVTVEPEVAPDEVEEGELDSDAPWHVVLLDDSQHTHAYVIEMLGAIFGYSVEHAFALAWEVDTIGRVVVATCHLEQAEAFQERIHDYGADWRIESCLGSMSAILERSR